MTKRTFLLTMDDDRKCSCNYYAVEECMASPDSEFCCDAKNLNDRPKWCPLKEVIDMTDGGLILKDARVWVEK